MRRSAPSRARRIDVQDSSASAAERPSQGVPRWTVLPGHFPLQFSHIATCQKFGSPNARPIHHCRPMAMRKGCSCLCSAYIAYVLSTYLLFCHVLSRAKVSGYGLFYSRHDTFFSRMVSLPESRVLLRKITEEGPPRYPNARVLPLLACQ